MQRLKNVRRVLLYTLALNVIVAVLKIFYGYTIDSVSMVSDGFHSFFDGTSNVIGLIGVWVASQPPDADIHTDTGNSRPFQPSLSPY